jgi:hypothetical protein
MRYVATRRLTAALATVLWSTAVGTGLLSSEAWPADAAVSVAEQQPLPDAASIGPRTAFSQITPTSLRLAIEDLAATFGSRYPRARQYLGRLEQVERLWTGSGQTGGVGIVELESLAHEALLDNPLLDFDRLLVVKRRPVTQGQVGCADTAVGHAIGLPRSSMGHCVLPRNAFDNEIAVLEPITPAGTLTTLYRPPHQRVCGRSEPGLRCPTAPVCHARRFGGVPDL